MALPRRPTPRRGPPSPGLPPPGGGGPPSTPSPPVDIPQMANEMNRGALLRRMQSAPGAGPMPPQEAMIPGMGPQVPPPMPEMAGMQGPPPMGGPPPTPEMGGPPVMTEPEQGEGVDVAGILNGLLSTRNSRRVLSGGQGADGY